MAPNFRLTPEDLFRIETITDARIAPGGDVVAYVVQTPHLKDNKYTSAIWTASLTDLSSRRFTSGSTIDTAPRWSPDGQRLAFISDRSGQRQVWLIDRAGGEASRLTDWPHGITDLAWSPNGRCIAFVAKSAPDEESIQVVTRLRYRFDGVGYIRGQYQHIWILDVASGDMRQLTGGDQDDVMPAWSPDGTEIAFASNRADDQGVMFRSAIWVVSSDGGEPRRLTTDNGMAEAPAWTPDGKHLAYIGYTGPYRGVNNRIWLIPRTGGTPQDLTARFDGTVGVGLFSDTWSSAAVTPYPQWAPDGNACYVSAAERGRVGIYRIGLDGNVLRVVSGDRACAFVSLSADGSRLAFAASDHVHPVNLFAAKADGSGERALTDLNSWLAKDFALQSPEAFTFSSFDGRPIDGWLFRPSRADGPAPLILHVHGGPHSIFGHTFFFDPHMLTAQGYAVLWLNPRATQSYGEDFATCNIGDWGGGDYRDLMAGLDYALGLGGLDAEGLGVMGLSYGGYMANWIIGQTTRFKAAISENGISNLVSMLGTSDIGWYFNVTEAGATFWDDPQKWMRQSPISYANAIRTPTLFLNCESDHRCPIEQGEQLYTALKTHGCETEMVRFPGESHAMLSVGKPRSRLERRRHMLRWLKAHLDPSG